MWPLDSTVGTFKFNYSLNNFLHQEIKKVFRMSSLLAGALSSARGYCDNREESYCMLIILY